MQTMLQKNVENTISEKRNFDKRHRTGTDEPLVSDRSHVSECCEKKEVLQSVTMP